MVRQLLVWEDMQTPLLSFEQHDAPRPAPQPGFSFGAASQADAAGKPTNVKSLRTRFNPNLIGFGIVGLSVSDSNEQENSGKIVSAVGVFIGRNAEDQK